MIYMYICLILTLFFQSVFFSTCIYNDPLFCCYIPSLPFEALCWQACCYQSARPCSLFNCREVPWKADSPSRKCTLSTLWSLCYHMFLLKLIIGWLFIFAGSSLWEVFTPIWKLYHILAFEAKNQSPFPFPERIMVDQQLNNRIFVMKAIKLKNLGKILSPPSSLALSHKGLALQKSSPRTWSYSRWKIGQHLWSFSRK